MTDSFTTTKVTVNAPIGVDPEALGRAAAEAMRHQKRVADSEPQSAGSTARLTALLVLLSAQVVLTSMAFLGVLLKP